jgi:hypothetical protein
LQLLLAVAASVAIFLPWSVDIMSSMDGAGRALSGWEMGLGKFAVMLIVSSCFVSFIEAALKQRATLVHLILFIFSLVVTFAVLASARMHGIPSWGMYIHFFFAIAFYSVSIMRTQNAGLSNLTESNGIKAGPPRPDSDG